MASTSKINKQDGEYVSKVGKPRGSSPSRKPSMHHTVVSGGEGRTVGTAEHRHWFCFLRKSVKGRFVMLHGQGTLKLVKGETGCVGPVEEVRLLGWRK